MDNRPTVRRKGIHTHTYRHTDSGGEGESAVEGVMLNSTECLTSVTGAFASKARLNLANSGEEAPERREG